MTLYWWGYDGEKVPYATVAPGGHSTQSTSPTHPWTAEATDGSGVTIAGGEVYNVTEAQNQVVSISDGEAAPSQHCTDEAKINLLIGRRDSYRGPELRVRHQSQVPHPYSEFE